MIGRDRAIDAYRQTFGTPPTHLASAPGRVNLIGDHTDYQDGFVLPMALHLRTWIAFTPIDGDWVDAVADDLGSRVQFGFSKMRARPRAWSNYLIGVANELQKAGKTLRGWEGVIASDVPRGSGLSSSAALEIASLVAFTVGVDWDPLEMALLAQRAENEWVGMNSGIMDQLVSAAATEGTALFIDCHTNETESVALPSDTTTVVMDTSTRRGLVDSEYNERRAACERVAATLGVPSLRFATLGQLDRHAARLSPVEMRRGTHVITENERVASFRAAGGDRMMMGKLMNESHESLARDFEVSTPALDAITALARHAPGCLGARLTGAGFGGAAVALVDRAATQAFVEEVTHAFHRQTGLVPSIFATTPGPGARLEHL